MGMSLGDCQSSMLTWQHVWPCHRLMSVLCIIFNLASAVEVMHLCHLVWYNVHYSHGLRSGSQSIMHLWQPQIAPPVVVSYQSKLALTCKALPFSLQLDAKRQVYILMSYPDRKGSPDSHTVSETSTLLSVGKHDSETASGTAAEPDLWSPSCYKQFVQYHTHDMINSVFCAYLIETNLNGTEICYLWHTSDMMEDIYF